MPGYDAFLLLSFGGPEGPGDVMPFLENVTRGRGVPPERLAEVAEHYYAAGGVSPINAQCRDMLAAIEAAGLGLPTYWGNRNWDPYLEDTVRRMADDGVERAVAFVTSAYSSYSACRQYRDDIEKAAAAVGPRAPRIDKIRPYFNHPGFIEPFAANAGRPWTRCLLTRQAAPGWCSPRTACRWAWRRPAAAWRRGRPAQGPLVAGTRLSWRKLPVLLPNGRVAAPCPATSFTRAAAARQASHGWSRISATTSSRWPRTESRRSSWFPWGSSATTWRSCTTST